MFSFAQTAMKNPLLFGVIVGAVIGLIIGVIIDLIFFHLFIRGLVIGAVVGGAVGWWQHKLIAARAAKFLLGRVSPL